MTDTGDTGKKGFEATLGSVQSRLQAFIGSRVRIREDAEDIFQTVICQFLRVSTALDPVENVTAWLFRSARNAITDQARKKREVLFSALFDDDGDSPEYDAMCDALLADPVTPEDEHLRLVIQQEIEAALRELPEDQRDIYLKTELEGLSYRDIARETGENINTLLARKHRAVRHLRERLRDLYEDIVFGD